jgi:serine/threonine protein kinase
MMTRVRHPNVIQVYDYDEAVVSHGGEERRVRYIAMEYVAGPDLRSTMPAEGFGRDETAIRRWIRDCLLPILNGVEALHALGIVHRDLKPENILLDAQVPKIGDFGIAGGRGWRKVTRSHHIAGTVPYQASEQFFDMGDTDARADIYSLGKVLYEAVSGRMVDKETALPWREAHLRLTDTPFLRELDRIVRRATAEDRSQRTPSAGALRLSLVRLLGDDERARSAAGQSLWRLPWPESPQTVRAARRRPRRRPDLASAEARAGSVRAHCLSRSRVPREQSGPGLLSGGAGHGLRSRCLRPVLRLPAALAGAVAARARAGSRAAADRRDGRESPVARP